MNEKINLQELIVLLTQKSDITKKEAEAFLKECFDTMHDALLEDRLVKVKNLGAFKLAQVNDRESIDVVTGERVLIPAHYKVNFSAENSLAQTINEPFSLFVPVELNEDNTIVDSDEIITFTDEEDEWADNNDDNNDDFELVLEDPENTGEPINFVSEENDDTEKTEDDFVFDREVKNQEKVFVSDENSENKPKEEILSEKTEIERINTEPATTQSVDITLNIEEIIGEIVVPADTPPIEIPPIEEVKPFEPIKTEQIEIPPIPAPSNPIEILPIQEVPSTPIEIPSIPKPSVPIEAPPIQSSGNYTVYNPRKHRLEYPRWLIIPTYIAIIFCVVFIFYYLYLNLSDGGVSDPPIISSPVTGTDATIAEATGNNTNTGNTVSTNTDNDDSLKNALKEKFGDLLIGLPEKTTPDKEPAKSPSKPPQAGKKVILKNGQTLTMLALNEYGNKCFWVYIYEENKQIIKNPNNVPAGTELIMPPPTKYEIDKNNAASVKKAMEKADQIQSGQ